MKRRPNTLISAGAVAIVAALSTSTSCAPSGFADPTVVQTVRILASSADKPYAAPGATVTLQVLADDARPSKPAPMTIYWLPFVCENPAEDAYYSCFSQIERLSAAGSSGGGGGASDAGAASPEAGPDAGGGLVGPGGVLQNLPTGPSYTFEMPANAVSSHVVSPGTAAPYGLAVLFNIACAGHLELVPIDPSNLNPQSVPIGCFDENHHALSADDWVFGFTRVYAYDTLTNHNPVISYVDVAGAKLPVTAQPDTPQAYTTPACDSSAGCLSMPRCTGDAKDCQLKLGPVVPPSSWELNPEATDVNGKPLHEEIWVDFFTTNVGTGSSAAAGKL